MNPQELAKQLRKPEGDIGIEVGEFMAKGNQNFYDQIPFLFQKERFPVVLEVGMGAGKHISSIVAAFDIESYYALDYSSLMVKEAKKNNSNLKVLEVLCGDAHELSFEDKQFDLVFTVNTVYFYQNISKVFKEYYRVLKDNGILLVGKRTKDDLKLLSMFTQYGFDILSIDDIEKEMKKLNFQDINSKVIDDPKVNFGGQEIQLHSEFIWAKKQSN